MSKFKYTDFAQPDFDAELFVSPIELKKVPREGVPLNAYKQFKAIKHGETHYMSGKRNGY